MTFRYLIVHEDYTVNGTNDESLAIWLAEFNTVIDMETRKQMRSTNGETYKMHEIEKCPDYREDQDD